MGRNVRIRRGRRCLIAALALLFAAPAAAGRVHVAVATNFTAAMKEIVAQFGWQTGHEAIIS